VRTAGEHSKFGIPLFELDELARLSESLGVRIVGLHAHTGSGIFSVRNWIETAELLAGLRERFPDVRTLDLGGGLGVPERPGELPLDLAELNKALEAVRKAQPGLEVWLEPGRFIVAEAGVLLAQVTQLKGKGEFSYVGVATGMNSLIRPALYGSHHEIVNLTRLDEPATETCNIVGPICESGDQLGVDRLLPPTREGDILLIANAGAYGRAMSSNYNLRVPAAEHVL
jgi:diaminopimelate decarboxylase/aspartate kinase